MTTTPTRRRRSISWRRRIELYKRDGFECQLCHRNCDYHGDLTQDDLRLDHIIPFSTGGTCDDDNLQTLCHDCNAWKRDRIL